MSFAWQGQAGGIVEGLTRGKFPTLGKTLHVLHFPRFTVMILKVSQF